MHAFGPRADDLLSPLGRSRNRPTLPLAPRLDGLAGRTVGLLDNSKQNAGLFLDEIEDLLRRGGVGAVLRFRKPTAAISAGAEVDVIAERCDALVNAFGDCGSCTSWCVHDSVDVERRGVPVATVNTVEFATLGRFEAAALGMAELPIVAIRHPVGSLDEAAVRDCARAALDDIVTVLTRDAGDTRTDYRSAAGAQTAGAPGSGEVCGCAA